MLGLSWTCPFAVCTFVPCLLFCFLFLFSLCTHLSPPTFDVVSIVFDLGKRHNRVHPGHFPSREGENERRPISCAHSSWIKRSTLLCRKMTWVHPVVSFPLLILFVKLDMETAPIKLSYLSRALSLRNLVLGYECGRVFPAGVGPGSPSRDAVNWLPSRFSLSVETRRRFG